MSSEAATAVATALLVILSEVVRLRREQRARAKGRLRTRRSDLPPAERPPYVVDLDD